MVTSKGDIYSLKKRKYGLNVFAFSAAYDDVHGVVVERAGRF